MENKFSKILQPGILAILVLYLLHTLLRSWSADESMYILAGKLWSEGKLPYRDFSYRQMPAYPAFLWVWQSIGSHDLLWNRLPSFLSILAWIFLALRYFKDGIWACLLTLSNPWVLDYFVLVKPYAHCTLLVTLGLVFWMKSKPILSSLFMGAASMIRLLYLPSALVGLFATLLKTENRIRRTLLFSLGAFIALLPAIVFLLVERERFLFNVMGFHTRKSVEGRAFSLDPIFGTFGLILSEPPNLLFLLLLILALSLFLILRKEQGHEWKRFALFLMTGFAVVLPAFSLRPFYDEYVIAGIPFFAFAMAELGFFSAQFKRMRVLQLSVLVICILWGTVDGIRRVHHGLLVYRGKLTSQTSRESVKKVGMEIQKLIPPSGNVLTFWSGYVLAAKRSPYPGLETGLVTIEMEGKVTEKDAERFRLLTPKKVLEAVERRDADLIAIGMVTPKGFESWVQRFYRLEKEVEGVRLYLPSRSN